MLSLGAICNYEGEKLCTFFSSYTAVNAINTVLVVIFVFDTRVTKQRSRMIKRGKSCKEKGRERREVFNNKDGFQNRNED